MDVIEAEKLLSFHCYTRTTVSYVLYTREFTLGKLRELKIIDKLREVACVPRAFIAFVLLIRCFDSFTREALLCRNIIQMSHRMATLYILYNSIQYKITT